MIRHVQTLLALDVGEKRVGIAKADTATHIPFVLDTLDVDETIFRRIDRLCRDERATTLVVGYPRNLSGEATAQSHSVEEFVEKLKRVCDLPVSYQDESLTSVHAEEQLKALKKPYTKADIDAQSALLILRDYLEAHGY